MVVRVTKITGSSSDDWIYCALRLQVLLITLKYSSIGDLYNFQFAVAHASGLFVFTSRLLATYLNTETSTSNHYEVFLLLRFQSLWNLGIKNSSRLTAVPFKLRNSSEVHLLLTPPPYDWLVSATNWACRFIHFFYMHSAQTSRKTQTLLLKTSPLS
jgi:hypothetical protein